MTFSLPTDYTLRRAISGQVVRGQPIRSAQVVAAADNAHFTYARANLRTVGSLGVFDSSGLGAWTAIARIPFRFAAGREAVGLQVVGNVSNTDVRVTIRDAANTTDLRVLTDTVTVTGAFSTATGSSADADVLVLVEVQDHAVGAASLNTLHIFELGHSALTFPGLAIAEDLADNAIAAGLSHVWTLDQDGTSTEDLGSTGGATLSRTANVTNTAPSVTGSRGYDRITVHAATTGTYTGLVLNTVRDTDMWFEGVFTFPGAQGASNYNMVMAGEGSAAGGLAYVRYHQSVDVVRVYSSDGVTLFFSLTGLNAATLAAGPVYIAVWWDSANATMRGYWNAGSGETALAAAGTAQVGSVTRRLGIGYSAGTSAKQACHYLALHRGGALTSTHRNTQYAALGW